MKKFIFIVENVFAITCIFLCDDKNMTNIIIVISLSAYIMVNIVYRMPRL
jgi:hypothetical protein